MSAGVTDDLLRIQSLHQSGDDSGSRHRDRHSTAVAKKVAVVEDERLRYAGNDAGAPAEDDAWALHFACEDLGRAGPEREVACPHGWSHPLLHSARFLPSQLAPTAAAGALVPHRWLVAAAAGVLRASSADVQRLRFCATLLKPEHRAHRVGAG